MRGGGTELLPLLYSLFVCLTLVYIRCNFLRFDHWCDLSCTLRPLWLSFFFSFFFFFFSCTCRPDDDVWTVICPRYIICQLLPLLANSWIVLFFFFIDQEMSTVYIKLDYLLIGVGGLLLAITDYRLLGLVDTKTNYDCF